MRLAPVVALSVLVGGGFVAWIGRGSALDAARDRPSPPAPAGTAAAIASGDGGPDLPPAPVAPVARPTVEADVFHPDRQPGPNGKRPPLPAPAYGGRATIHLESLPGTLNDVIENKGVVRRMQHELSETLLLRDWETLELGPNLAQDWRVEDAVHLRAERSGTGALPVGALAIGRDGAPVLRGVLTREDERGVALLLGERGPVVPERTPSGARPVVDGVAFEESIPAADIARIERGTVITLHLRDDVTWHDGHPFDARDVVFSIELYKNPLVNCGQRRVHFATVLRAEALDALTVRVWFDTQSYYRLTALGTELMLLPSHLYDLADADNAEGAARRKAEPAWTPDEKDRAEFINKNPHNRAWVGLGPYRVKRFDDQGVLAERYAGYFDPARAGWLDEIFWRFVKDDVAAFQALLNGELDFFARVGAEDYFGPTTSSAAFQERLYKGHFYSGNYNFTVWNLRRQALADVRVREAIARAFDAEGFKTSAYRGLADQVTGPWILTKPEYNQDVRPYPRDVEKAQALVEAAGWIDRDGDGIADKDGVKLEIELAAEAGFAINRLYAARMQEDLAKIGIAVTFLPLDAAALDEKRKKRDFDGIVMAWAVAYETDPEQVWHSKGAPIEAKSSNFGGFADARCDDLIAAGQKELDTAKRAAIWRALHARIYELQPYLFGFSPPRKFAIRKDLRGVQLVTMDPNYVLRRWYYAAGTPGTRATLEKR